MAAFATPDWIDELAQRARDATAPDDLAMTIEQRVDDDAWHFVVADGSIAVSAGHAEEPTLTLQSNRATAEAIQRGELSAQRAFLDGALRIGGDITALMANRAALESVGALLGPAT